jgi:hypothetical protein
MPHQKFPPDEVFDLSRLCLAAPAAMMKISFGIARRLQFLISVAIRIG